MTLSKCKVLLLVKMKLLEVCSLNLSFSFIKYIILILNRLKL
jgi:hypothetical protein